MMETGIVMTKEWRSSPFGCFDCEADNAVSSCIAGMCCPLCALACGFSASHGQCECGSCLLYQCCGLSPASYSLFRKGHHIKGSQCRDCMYFSFCIPCAACRVLREQEARGSRPFMLSSRNPIALDWNTDLCDCCANPGSCVYGCCCPCCAFASAAEQYSGLTWCYSLCCLSYPVLRYDMRQEYNIEGSCCGDVLAVTCCPGCAYVQMKMEVEVKGSAFQKQTTDFVLLDDETHS